MPSNPRDAKQPIRNESGSESYSGMNQGVAGSSPAGTTEALVVELVVTSDLRSDEPHGPCGFESRPGHEEISPSSTE